MEKVKFKTIGAFLVVLTAVGLLMPAVGQASIYNFYDFTSDDIYAIPSSQFTVEVLASSGGVTFEFKKMLAMLAVLQTFISIFKTR